MPSAQLIDSVARELHQHDCVGCVKGIGDPLYVAGHAHYYERLATAALRSPALAAMVNLAETVVMLEDAGCGADCGKALHGMSGEQHGGCSYCEAVAAVRAASTERVDDA